MHIERSTKPGRNHPINPLFVLLALVCIISAAWACSPWPFGTDELPGEGEQAEQGYKVCAPIIVALEEIRAANDEYPDTLDDLVPGYLLKIPAEVNGNPITYQKTEDGYILSFKYIGPGMNYCNYSPEEGWHCSGAY